MDEDEPPKPVPSTETDTKQIAGPSYSTRSNAKRSSHSDNDSSRSQADPPPLKRRAEPGAKQANKSVRVNNDPTPGAADPTDTNTSDERTPAEIALQNELVLESLLSYMNRSDLLSCRLVNKQWQYEATKELRRRKLIIKFSFHCHGNRIRPKKVFQNICRVLSGCRTPALLSSFQLDTVLRNDLSSTGVKSIFTAVENQIKNLTLNLNYSSKQDTESFKTSSLMTNLYILLFRQTPNLQFLEIKFEFPSHWKYELQRLDPSAHPPADDNNEFLQLPNLKTFIVTGTPPQKFFGDVIRAAVNLSSLGGVFSCEFSALIKYFMGDDGRGKIHLLKDLRMHLVIRSRVQCHKLGTDLLGSFLAEHKKNLQLENFECVPIVVDQNSSAEPRILNVVNQILECSTESLRKLRIEPLNWFDGFLVIPRLPKLQEIYFDCIWSSYVGAHYGEDFFPRGFNMNYNFPSVSSIVFLRCTAQLFRRFVYSIEVTEAVPSVRHIIMMDAYGNNGNDGARLLASDFRHVFPKLVSISYYDENCSYKI